MTWWLGLFGCAGVGEPVPVAVALPGDLEVRLSAHGEFEAKNSLMVHAPAFSRPQTIGWIVAEGVEVREGDPLVEFDTAELIQQIQSAEAGLESERTRIAQRLDRLAIERADASAAIVRAELDRDMARLRVTDSEAVPAIEREGARVAVERAEIALAKARTAARTVELEARSEVDLLRLQVQAKEARLATLRAELEQAVVRAPMDGLALPRAWNVGNVVWPGYGLVSLPDLSEMIVVAKLPEADVYKAFVGQDAWVVIDAYPTVRIPARVTQVAEMPVVPRRRGNQPVKLAQKLLEVRLEIDPPTGDGSPRLRPGMTVRADLLVEARQAALRVPIQAIRSEADGPSVLVRSLGGWSRRTVTLGPENALEVVVEDGLAAGDVVALADPDAWAAGDRPVVTR